MFIDPRGQYGLRKTIHALNATRARIKQTDQGAEIAFSDGRSTTTLVREPHVSSETFIAAAVQWTRRRGIVSIEIEL
jgi:hypothetical protein